MSTKPSRGCSLTTVAQIAAIVSAIVAILAFAHQMEWWPFDIAKATPVSSSAVALTLVPTSAPTSVPTAVRPTAAPTEPAVSSSSSTLGIGSTKISPIDGATMVFVPEGEFLMGSTDQDIDTVLTICILTSCCEDCQRESYTREQPQHSVYLDKFWIDKFEVTNALYKKCVDAGKCSAPLYSKSSTRSAYYGNSQYDNYPVIRVSWDDATKYCTWTSKKLPTEAQWEKAARGTDGRIYPWGNNFDGTKLNSSDSNPRLGDTTAVGSYPSGASPYGAMDMVGNLWEWVADWYDPNYYASSPRSNPEGPSSGQGRVLRGGSWVNNLYFVRAASRGVDDPGARYDIVGFRCVE